MLEEDKQKLDQKSSDNQSDIENQPLYQGSRLTVSMSMLLIVTFATRHNLSGVDLCDLLNLLEVHCPSDNIQGNPYYVSRLFQEIENASYIQSLL